MQKKHHIPTCPTGHPTKRAGFCTELRSSSAPRGPPESPGVLARSFAPAGLQQHRERLPGASSSGSSTLVVGRRAGGRRFSFLEDRAGGWCLVLGEEVLGFFEQSPVFFVGVCAFVRVFSVCLGGTRTVWFS